jgi:molybdopterin biosynthesis enzyme MoaB
MIVTSLIDLSHSSVCPVCISDLGLVVVTGGGAGSSDVTPRENQAHPIVNMDGMMIPLRYDRYYNLYFLKRE